MRENRPTALSNLFQTGKVSAMDKEKPVTEKSENKSGEKRRRRRAVRFIAITVAAFFILYFAGKTFLATPYAAGVLSGYLSESLKQRVVVSSIGLSGITASIHGVTVADPEGFPNGVLFKIRSLHLTPNLPSIMAGNRNFTRLQVDGLAVSLRKNDLGEWNYRQLIQNLIRPKKRPAAEIFVSRLIFRDVSLNINDYAVENLALTVNDFSTKGLVDSKLVFTGSDEKGNPFRLAAEGRLGKDPDLRIFVDAPDLSLGVFRDMTKGKSALALADGIMHLSLTIRYRSGEAVTEGRASFDHIGIVVKQRTVPLRGVFDFAGRYLPAQDEAHLEQLSLSVNDTIKLDATGRLRDLKGAKAFDARLSCNKILLKKLPAFLPKEMQKDLAIDGSVTCGDLQLTGNATQGITSGSGKLFLRNGSAVKGAHTLFQGLTSDVVLARTTGGWNMDGRFLLDTPTGKVHLDKLDARFTAGFSERFSPVSLKIAALKARVMGVPMQGDLTWSPRDKDPFKVALAAEKAPLAILNGLLGRKDIVFSSGTANISVHGTGRGPAKFAGEMRAAFSGSAGVVSGKKWTLKEGKIVSRFDRSAGKHNASGTVHVAGGTVSGHTLSTSFAYSLTDDTFSLHGGEAAFRHTTVRFASLKGRLPVREAVPAGASYPLDFTFTGLELADREIKVRDASGSVSAAYTPGAKAGGLVGRASLSVPAASFRGRPVGSATARVIASGEGTVTNIDGKVFDGVLSAVLRYDPFSPAKGVSFTGRIHDAQVAKLSGFLPDRLPVKFDSGKISTTVEGGWSGQAGLRCGIESSGHALTVATRNRKTLIRDARLNLNANMANGNVNVKQAIISHGEKVALKISGGIADAAAKSRTGKFSFDLTAAPVNSLFDSIVNILPKPLQESDGSGKVGARATLAVNGEKMRLEGEMHFDDILLEIPSQKLIISGMHGVLPFSNFFAEAKIEKPSGDLIFSRENFPELVKILREKATGGHLLKIGKIRFGALETDNVRLRTKAEKGRIDILAIESDLYNGTVFGNGYFLYDRGPFFEMDMLIKDMSLRQFCNSYPAVKGYISGLLDGVVSIYGEKGGIPAMIGFVDLWAHKGKEEKMHVSKEFLQKLAGKNLKGFFFRDDRPYDRGEISAYLMEGYITFDRLNISHTNLLGMKDLNVSVAPAQNMIGLEHFLQTIREAAARGKPATGKPAKEAPAAQDLNWLE